MSDGGLVEALARCQGKFPAITKAHSNPAYKGSKYADLSDVLAAVRPVLSAEGIAVVQPIVTDGDGRVMVYTRLLGHGETLESSLPLHIANMTPQQLGSTLTYYRRYMLAALLGCAAEDDDDGNAAQTAAVEKPVAVKGDPNVLAAASPPEKPLRDMTAGEMARYGDSIGVRVSGNKTEILRQLEPYVMAATGAEPFEVDGVPPIKELAPDTRHATSDVEGTLPAFEPVVADAYKSTPGSIRAGLKSTERTR